MGDKKEQGQSSEGAPNPWIYDVAKRHPEELQPGYNQSAERFYYEQPPLMLPSQRSPLPGRWRRRRLLLWIAVFVLCLLIAASILILSLIMR